MRVVPGSKGKAAAVETVVTAAKNGGIFKRHEYRVRDGEQGIWIITTLRNETAEKQKVGTKDEWTRFNETGEAGGIRWADAVDPADGCGYAFAQGAAPGGERREEGRGRFDLARPEAGGDLVAVSGGGALAAGGMGRGERTAIPAIRSA